MGDAELKPKTLITQELVDDFSRLLAKCMSRGNISWLADLVLNGETKKIGGDDVGELEAFAAQVVQQLKEQDRIAYAIDLLLHEAHPNGLLALGLRHILAGNRLESDEALQKFINEHEPLLGSADIIELLPRITRRVCAVGLGTPHNKIIGSGFLIAKDVVLTNFHVVEPFLSVDPVTKEIKQNAPGKELFFFFDYLKAPAPDVPPTQQSTCCVVTAAENWLLQARQKLAGDGTSNSPKQIKDEYDYAVIKLASPVGALSARAGGGVRRGWLQPEVNPDYLSGGQRIIVFQHPEELPQHFDVGDYVQLDPSQTRVWYSVNTARGSSGGAAVNTRGNLFALHNAEVKVTVPGVVGKRVNQGIRIDLITKELSAVVPPEPLEEDDGKLLWSLNDVFKDSRPIIGRSDFRENVMRVHVSGPERVLLVRGTPPVGLNFSVKLLRRLLGTHVPVIEFRADKGELLLTATEFLKVVVDEFNLGSISDNPIPEPKTTEAKWRWLRFDLAPYLLRRLSKDQESNPSKYPAWIVVNTILPEGQRVKFEDELREFIPALLGVHDKNQPAIDLPQLRWLFLATPTTNLPLDGVKRVEEDLDTQKVYDKDFAECYQNAYLSIDKQGEFPPGSLLRFAAVELKNNDKETPDRKLHPRKLLSNYIRALIETDVSA